jgi:hypothetical protein
MRQGKGEAIMMKTVLRGLFAFSALAGAVVLPAQSPNQPASPAADQTTSQAADLTADQVVARHIEALGGKDAISQVKSMTMENSVQVMGNEAPNTILLVDGVGYKSETDFNGTKIIQCYTDKGGWQVNPMGGAPDPTPMSDDEYKIGKESISVGGPLLDYAAKGAKVELVSKDADTYKVKLTTKDNVAFTYVFDAKTYYVKSMTTKGNMQGQEVDLTTNYSDYRKTDTGFLVPYAMDIDFGGQFSLSIAVKKIELNKTIDPAVFEMPKAPAAATPAKPAA